MYSINWRGCSGEPNRTGKSYNVGDTGDLREVISHLREMHPNNAFYFSGFSLGGNVILKLLGELGEQACEAGIAGAAVACIPFDLEASNSLLSTGFSKHVYAANFLSTLKKKALRQRLIHPDLDWESVAEARTVGEFDDAFTAPVWGYSGYLEYYKDNDSRQFLPRIRVPTFVVNALDDPFVSPTSLPEASLYDFVTMAYTEQGGHCGFISEEEASGQCFLGNELARFLTYIDDVTRRIDSGSL
mmetsp:Transcript_12428/g.25295  ORF Transcript_12428/g.25295 Transcript_12428/m.25295 type:complete len:244 (-) Transcript_12428:242-973(-)